MLLFSYKPPSCSFRLESIFAVPVYKNLSSSFSVLYYYSSVELKGLLLHTTSFNSQPSVISREMENPSANKNMPPPGYPTGQTMQLGDKPVRPKTQARGEKGFIEGCLAALCCCWICETCCI